MKVFQFKLALYNTNSILKKGVLLIALFFCLFNLNAQEKGNIKLEIRAGFTALSNSESLGLFLNVEPKIKSSENTFIGLRLGVTINSQTIESKDISQFKFDDKNDNGFISLVPTFDYYLNKFDFRPYLGMGIGVYLLANEIDVFQFGNVFEASSNKQIGFLLRGGFQLDRVKFGLEYNFIPKSDIEIPNGQAVGTVESSYLGLSIGFAIGGGKS